MNKYKIGHIWYKQSELTLKKDRQLFKYYNKIAELKKTDQELSTISLIDNDSDAEIFYGIILDPVINFIYILSFKWIKYLLFKKINIKAATNSQVEKIDEDFFLINNGLMKKLLGLENITGPIDRIRNKLTESNQPKKSSIPKKKTILTDG